MLLVQVPETELRPALEHCTRLVVTAEEVRGAHISLALSLSFLHARSPHLLPSQPHTSFLSLAVRCRTDESRTTTRSRHGQRSTKRTRSVAILSDCSSGSEAMRSCSSKRRSRSLRSAPKLCVGALKTWSSSGKLRLQHSRARQPPSPCRGQTLLLPQDHPRFRTRTLIRRISLTSTSSFFVLCSSFLIRPPPLLHLHPAASWTRRTRTTCITAPRTRNSSASCGRKQRLSSARPRS